MLVIVKKYLLPNSIASFLFISIVIVVACVGTFYSHLEYRMVKLDFLVHSDRKVEFEIYYDLGRGLSQHNRQAVMIDEVNEDVTLSFCVPVHDRLNLIRFDPARTYVRMKVKKIGYSINDGAVHPIPLASIKPANDIANLDIVEGELLIETAADANDPGLYIPGEHLSIGRADRGGALLYGKGLLAGFVLAVFFRSIYLFFIKIS